MARKKSQHRLAEYRRKARKLVPGEDYISEDEAAKQIGVTVPVFRRIAKSHGIERVRVEAAPCILCCIFTCGSCEEKMTTKEMLVRYCEELFTFVFAPPDAPKCRRCKKPQDMVGAAWLWKCPACGATNLVDHGDDCTLHTDGDTESFTIPRESKCRECCRHLPIYSRGEEEGWVTIADGRKSKQLMKDGQLQVESSDN